jgi:hypothetical protein
MRVDDVASDLMVGEYPDYGGHAADRGGIGAKVVNDQVASQSLGENFSWIDVRPM